MRPDTRQRKHAMAGLRAIEGQNRLLGTLVRVISSGKQALDGVMLVSCAFCFLAVIYFFSFFDFCFSPSF